LVTITRVKVVLNRVKITILKVLYNLNTML